MMNLQQAIDTRKSQKSLIQERNALNEALMIDNEVCNKSISVTLEATGLINWKEAHAAYNEEKITPGWRNFVNRIKERKAEINAALHDLPRIPMKLHREMVEAESAIA